MRNTREWRIGGRLIIGWKSKPYKKNQKSTLQKVKTWFKTEIERLKWGK